MQGVEDTYADLQEDTAERQSDMRSDREAMVELVRSGEDRNDYG